MKKPSRYLVVYDDGMGLCFPYGWDDEVAGALSSARSFVLFQSHKAARAAIKVSSCLARLQLAQGKFANTDFTDSLKHIKVVPCFDSK